ncbi:MAG: flagellar assembly protein FliH [Burkholderiales bacterium]|nr:flagellar assembly protein FliH [Burkholderiales bacterium]
MKAWGSKKIFRGSELGEVERWQVGEFRGPSVQRPYLRDAEPVAVVEAVHEPVAEEEPAEPLPEEPVGPTPEEIEAIRQAARLEGYREGFDKGRADGHAQGLIDGRAEGHAQGLESGAEAARVALQDDLRQLRELLTHIESSTTVFEEALAEPVLTLALGAARQMVRESLAQRPEGIVKLIREALDGLPELQGPFRVELHADDLALCKTHLVTEASAGHWRFDVGKDIERGGCRISNPSLEIDLTLPTRWRRVVEALGRSDEWKQGDEH